VSPTASLAPQTNLSEWQIRVINRHNHPFGRDFVKTRERRNCFAARIHVSLRFAQNYLETRDLDPALPPRVAFAGNRHPVLVLADRARFDGFRFDPAAVRSLMDREGWAGTVTVLWRQSAERLTARNLFPVGDIREDPATGSAAASTGAYLRAIGGVEPPATVTIDQGAHVGRPSVLTVDIPTSGGITVRGSAAPISVGS